MKFVANLIIKKNIVNEEDISSYVKSISEYVRHVDKLYIYNITKYPLDKFFDALLKYENIEYTTCEDLGEVLNYERALQVSLNDNADFSIILELGYYYEESVFNTIKSYILSHDVSEIGILTPLPLYGCQELERKSDETRYIQGGCNFVGAFINLHIYKDMGGLKREYYQSMFDYEYCIRLRLKNYKILLFNNLVLRNNNYRLVDKKIMFMTMTTYVKDPLDIYYEYRNRLFLWDEYKHIDPYYVKLDKKLAKAERHEMKWRDPGYRDKLVMFEKAKEDYKNGVMGKIKYEKRELQN